uniref:Putative secreted protein n=1 Tax=Anopheles darlingi TaxID=43151 RepID=A0A2M4DAW2_ANODA
MTRSCMRSFCFTRSFVISSIFFSTLLGGSGVWAAPPLPLRSRGGDNGDGDDDEGGTAGRVSTDTTSSFSCTPSLTSAFSPPSNVNGRSSLDDFRFTFLISSESRALLICWI